MGKRWTKKEEQVLLQGAGVYGVGWFQLRVGDSYEWEGAPAGRSAAALYSKARRLYGGGGLTRGAYSLRAVALKSGYSYSQIRRAMEALGQKWKRTRNTRGSYLIYEEQVDDLMEWLKKDCWAKSSRLYCCAWCSTESRPHKAVGLCVRCYARWAKRLERARMPIRIEELAERVRCWAQETGALVGLVAGKELDRKRACREIVLIDLLRAYNERS